MKEAFCYTATDYGGLLNKALAEPATAGVLVNQVKQFAAAVKREVLQWQGMSGSFNRLMACNAAPVVQPQYAVQRCAHCCKHSQLAG